MERSLQEIRSGFGGEAVSGPLSLDEYQELAGKTDKTGSIKVGSPDILLLGLYGEIGSLLSELKKKHRDDSAYFSYADSALEELGDVLWYFANIAKKYGYKLSDIASGEKFQEEDEDGDVESDEDNLPMLGAQDFGDLQPQRKLLSCPVSGPKVEARLLTLATKAGALIEHARNHPLDRWSIRGKIQTVFSALVRAADDAEIGLELAATRNLEKIVDRWPISRRWGDLYDESFDEDERLPRRFEISFKEKRVRGTAYVIQQCRGINLGDRLTDNRSEPDDYRFHDAFHISYATILGWSPVLRALLKLKRKSDDRIDEQQDGARAIIAEEGIANWIFSQGLRHEHFEHVQSLDFALLKTIRDMVKGYEVESRPLWMWERAILEGFRVFRELKTYRGGTLVADLNSRTLEYRRSNA